MDTADDWMPGGSLSTLKARSAMLTRIRAFFAARDVWEVETPLLGLHGGTDPTLESLQSRYTGPGYPGGVSLYLQTSPEFAMKRLLAAGSGAIYQICKAFRDGEAGQRHNPEFTMLEWYRPGYDAAALMDEVADVLRACLQRDNLRRIDVSYAELFRALLDIDIFALDAEGLKAAAREHALLGAEHLELDRDGWLNLLMSSLVEPTLAPDAMTFVTDFPASQAALARLNDDGRTAARFEVFYQGLELANGFDELVDAGEQSGRFEADNCRRKRMGQTPVPVDRHLLSAMEAGLPQCAGVAIGLDRVLMARLGLTDIDEVVSFSLGRT